MGVQRTAAARSGHTTHQGSQPGLATNDLNSATKNTEQHRERGNREAIYSNHHNVLSHVPSRVVPRRNLRMMAYLATSMSGTAVGMPSIETR